MTLVAIQIIASIAVLFISWEMYCDKPLRIFITVYIVRLVLTAPINIYTHLAPRRRPTSTVPSPRSSARAELSEAYAMSERNRPLSFPPPVLPTNHRQHYPAFVTPVQQPTPTLPIPDPFDENALKAWIDRAKSALDLFAVLWFIIGNYMIFSSSTCSDTAVPLYYFSLVIIVYGYLILSVPIFLCTSVIFCLPCVLVGMRLLHVDDGVYMGGATSEEIAMIPVYQFKSNPNIPLTTSTLIQHNSITATPTTTPNTINNINITKASTTSSSPSIMNHTTALSKNDSSIIQQTTSSTISNTVIGDDCHITIDLSKPDQPHRHQNKPRQKPGIFDKLWLYLGLIDPPCGSEPEYEVLEIPDLQDQVCVICLSTYEDGDILCKLWCKHHFHKACVHEWLVLNFRCPMCKQDSRGKDVMIDV